MGAVPIYGFIDSDKCIRKIADGIGKVTVAGIRVGASPGRRTAVRKTLLRVLYGGQPLAQCELDEIGDIA